MPSINDVAIDPVKSGSGVWKKRMIAVTNYAKCFRTCRSWTMKSASRFGLCASAVTLIIAIGMSAPAAAQTSQPLTICNKTDVPLNIAAGYPTLGVDDGPNHILLTGPFVTKGWVTDTPNTRTTDKNPNNAQNKKRNGSSTK